ncbi:unnamed protein product [Sphagnum troendelagicum]
MESHQKSCTRNSPVNPAASSHTHLLLFGRSASSCSSSCSSSVSSSVPAAYHCDSELSTKSLYRSIARISCQSRDCQQQLLCGCRLAFQFFSLHPCRISLVGACRIHAEQASLTAGRDENLAGTIRVYLSDTDDGRSSEEEENRDRKKMSEGIGRRTSSSSSSSAAAAAASWPPGRKKNKQALQLRIAQEEERKRKGDRDLTPTVRALTWAFRGAQDQQQSFLVPNVYTYNSLLGALKANGCYDFAVRILGEMRDNGIAADLVTYNTVISMYDQLGQHEQALKVFEELKSLGMQPDLFTYRTLIQLLARCGKVEQALDIFCKLKKQQQEEDWVSESQEGSENHSRPELKRERGQRQELATFVVQMCYKRFKAWLADDSSTVRETAILGKRMKVAQVALDAKMCKNLIRACGQREIDHSLVKILYHSMREQHFPIGVSLCNQVIRVLGKGKKWWAALEVYENMMESGPLPEETTRRLLLSHFQILLNSARKRRIWKWALQLLDKMMEKGIEPDSFAWNAALIACGRANETASAVQVFQQMTEHGQKPGVVSYGALLSALEKGNLLENAEQVWHHMQKVGVMPNDYAFTTMISAYGKAGNYSKAIELLDQMQATGVEPSVVTYNAVISACARAGDGQRALDWLEQMEAASIKPNATSYAQVIEALANEGQWKPALTLYNKMLDLRLDPPPMASDAVFRVCRANDAQVDLAFIQPQTLHVKVKHRVKRKVYKKPVSVATSVDYPIAAAFESVTVVANPHNAVAV